MGNMLWEHLPGNNPLADLHIAGTELLPSIRAEICKALGWTEPTYFRKMREVALNDKQAAQSVRIILDHIDGIYVAFKRYLPPPKMYHDYIEVNPKIMMGKPVIRGTRLTVELILERLAGGETIQDILIAFPRLTPKAIYASLLYAAFKVNS